MARSLAPHTRAGSRVCYALYTLYSGSQQHNYHTQSACTRRMDPAAAFSSAVWVANSLRGHKRTIPPVGARENGGANCAAFVSHHNYCQMPYNAFIYKWTCNDGGSTRQACAVLGIFHYVLCFQTSPARNGLILTWLSRELQDDKYLSHVQFMEWIKYGWENLPSTSM